MITRGDLSDSGRQLLLSPALRLALMGVIPYACVLVGLDVAARYGNVTGAALPAQFSMSTDGSFAEFLEYSLTTASSVMMLVLWRRTRAPVFLTSAILFTWLTLDNWGQVHEQIGHMMGESVPVSDALPIALNHLIESAVFGIVGLAWLAGIAVAIRRADTRRAIWGGLIALFIVGAAVFGVGVDIATSWGEHDRVTRNLLAFIEDGGEFVMIIAIFVLCVGIFDVERRERVSMPVPRSLHTLSA